MRINNGLTGSPLEKVKVEVNFTDENGVAVLASSDANDTNPNLKFFIRLDTLSNIDNVDGLATSTVRSRAQPASNPCTSSRYFS